MVSSLVRPRKQVISADQENQELTTSARKTILRGKEAVVGSTHFFEAWLTRAEGRLIKVEVKVKEKEVTCPKCGFRFVPTPQVTFNTEEDKEPRIASGDEVEPKPED